MQTLYSVSVEWGLPNVDDGKIKGAAAASVL